MHKSFLYKKKNKENIGMFEPKQIIEGKIFFHYRRDEMLAILTSMNYPAAILNVLSMHRILLVIL